MAEATFTVIVGLFFILVPLVADSAYDEFAERARSISGPDAPVGDLPAALLAVPIGIGLLVVSLAVVLMLRMLRSAAWLDGTVAYVRGALRTRSIDLSTAYVSAGTSTRQEFVGQTHNVRHFAVWEVPTLEAHDPISGRKLTIQLYRPGGGAIPPYALRALADAMVHRRGWHGNDRDVQELAQRLRRIGGGDRSPAHPADSPYGSSGIDQPAGDSPSGSYGATAAHWQNADPAGPGGFGPGAADHLSAPHLAGTPTPVRRQTSTGMKVMVALLAVVLLAGLGTAVAGYGTMLDGAGEKAAVAAAGATEVDAESQQPATLKAGESVEVKQRNSTVRITVDKIATYKSACAELVPQPTDIGYVTALVSVEVVSGTAVVSRLDFGFVGPDGVSYERVPTDFIGCGGPDFRSGRQSAGSKVSGYVGFEAPDQGLITFGDQQAAWRVG